MRFFVSIVRKHVFLQLKLQMIDFREFADENCDFSCSQAEISDFRLLHAYRAYCNQKLNDIFVKNSRLKLNRYSY